MLTLITAIWGLRHNSFKKHLLSENFENVKKYIELSTALELTNNCVSHFDQNVEL